MRVVQREAEDTFVSTASTLRGVRARRDDAPRSRWKELARTRMWTDEFEDDDALEEREETHGDDGETESEWHERPRVRPRTSERA